MHHRGVVIGPHRLLCGDVTRGAVATLMGTEQAHVIYSDPPWGEGNLRYWRTHAGDAARPTWARFLPAWAFAVANALAPGGDLFAEMGERWADDLVRALAAAGLSPARRWTVRYRSGPRWLPSALLYAGPGLPGDFDPSALHGAALPRACVAAAATRGGIVLDPCCGKGYTARAAVAAGMCFRGVELNPKRLAVTATWLQNRS